MVNLQDLIEELFGDASVDQRCPHILKDEMGPYCGKGLDDDNVSDKRRMICDHFSLQLWCLNSNYRNCIFYQGERIE